MLGVENTPGIQTVAIGALTIQGVFNALANAVQLINTSRFLTPTHVVMHPRRWSWLLSLLDNNERPLFLPDAANPFNAGGVQTDMAAQGAVGTTLGLPIILDPNITVSAGSESPVGDEDVVYVLRA